MMTIDWRISSQNFIIVLTPPYNNLLCWRLEVQEENQVGRDEDDELK